MKKTIIGLEVYTGAIDNFAIDSEKVFSWRRFYPLITCDTSQSHNRRVGDPRILFIHYGLSINKASLFHCSLQKLS
ncbi:hypothetical protein Bca52824_046481 [Brassica carinata]|uniref:Uncharacterized protein n=1 Tax=Brassica carinata TaxID=52824 RepID=A0A8X7UQ87_BRACI|nr:hypothetical protein Bca52824_046481 [Brassica carinata]